MLDYEERGELFRFNRLLIPKFIIYFEDMDDEEYEDLPLIVNMIKMNMMKIGF